MSQVEAAERPGQGHQWAHRSGRAQPTRRQWGPVWPKTLQSEQGWNKSHLFSCVSVDLDDLCWLDKIYHRIDGLNTQLWNIFKIRVRVCQGKRDRVAFKHLFLSQVFFFFFKCCLGSGTGMKASVVKNKLDRWLKCHKSKQSKSITKYKQQMGTQGKKNPS